MTAASQNPAPDSAPASAPNSLLERLLFLLFILAAFLLFAAPTLLPILQTHARLLEEERALTLDLKRLQARSDHLVAFAASLTDDPGTNERIARIDLGYQKPGESVLILPPPAPTADADTQPTRRHPDIALIPQTWPPWAQAAEQWASERGLLAPMLDPALRSTWMLMSAGLLIAAFTLFPPRRSAHAELQPAIASA